MIDPTASPSGAARTISPLAERIAAMLPEVPPDVRPGRAQLAEVVAAIAERFHPDRIVLFGSRAYGTPTYDSDVDLMVVMDTPLRNPEQAFRIRQTLDLRPSFPLDILVRRPAQIALGLAEGDFFIEDVISKGVTLHDEGRQGRLMTSKDANGSPTSGATLKQATIGWIDKAESDFEGARFLLTAPNPKFDLICYHAQQAAEKYLKGFLQEHAIPFPRTHNLPDLARLCAAQLPDAQAKLQDLQWLSDYAVDIRYPGVVAGSLEGERAIRIAEQVKTLVRTALGLAV